MEVVEKESFAFDLLNHLYDDYDLHADDYARLVWQIWEALTHRAMDGIISFLQGALLVCMRGF